MRWALGPSTVRAHERIAEAASEGHVCMWRPQGHAVGDVSPLPRPQRGLWPRKSASAPGASASCHLRSLDRVSAAPRRAPAPRAVVARRRAIARTKRASDWRSRKRCAPRRTHGVSRTNGACVARASERCADRSGGKRHRSRKSCASRRRLSAARSVVGCRAKLAYATGSCRSTTTMPPASSVGSCVVRAISEWATLETAPSASRAPLST